MELHCFVDAYQFLFSAVLYLRIKNAETFSSRLVFSKARLKSLSKSISIPRLELLGANLGSHQIRFFRTNTSLQISRTVLWTDNKCVLSWYNSSKILPVFIRNRIRNIKKANITELRYVTSRQNPADLLTKPDSTSSFEEIW